MRLIKALSVFILLSLLVLVIALFSLQNEVKMVQEQLEEVQFILSTPSTAEPDPNLTKEEHVVIFLVKSTPTHFYLVPVHRNVGGAAHPALALQMLLNGPFAHEELLASVPQNTKLLGLSVHEGLAIANFSREIVDNFNGGSLLESYLVKAIVNTLTEFPTINRVQLLVEGEPVESFGGHVLITGPLSRTD